MKKRPPKIGSDTITLKNAWIRSSRSAAQNIRLLALSLREQYNEQRLPGLCNKAQI
jgi:hypothetical protein